MPSLEQSIQDSWLRLAVVSLLASGFLSLLVGASRMPWLAQFVTDTQFARRGLIVHVDLGVLVWFGAMFVVLYRRERSMAAASAAALPRPSLLVRHSHRAGWIGIALLLLGLVQAGSTPLLVNYVPVIESHGFLIGLALIYLAMLVHFVPLRGFDWGALGGLFVLLTGVSGLAAFLQLPRALDSKVYYEALMWGPGHALQFANVCFLLLWANRTGSAPIPRGVSLFARGFLLIPAIGILALCTVSPTDPAYVLSHTRLMQWGIFPAVLAVLLAISRKGLSPKGKLKESAQLRTLALRWSAVLIVVGFVFGALIEGNDLRIPAHYHACIGAVTLALMIEALILLGRGGSRTSGWVAKLYGFGQLVFSSGLFIGGTYGMQRKTYGMEQQVSNTGQTLGFGVMAAGGLLAFTAGALFAVTVFRKGKARRS
ncbi:MAG: hypothetical protein IT285_13790 [Bdellovibrionales bacterium]|nr:hypothetical protein [Bdellovibrionales bacterium]